MKYETDKEKFERKLKYGADEWEQQPYNGMLGQPCPHGCIISKRVAPPLKYKLEGDCRAPSQEDCCMNVQYNDEYYRTKQEAKSLVK